MKNGFWCNVLHSTKAFLLLFFLHITHTHIHTHTSIHYMDIEFNCYCHPDPYISVCAFSMHKGDKEERGSQH